MSGIGHIYDESNGHIEEVYEVLEKGTETGLTLSPEKLRDCVCTFELAEEYV